MAFRFDVAYIFIGIGAIVCVFLRLLCCIGCMRDCSEACRRRYRERGVQIRERRAREEARIWVVMNPMNPRNRSMVGFSFSCSERGLNALSAGLIRVPRNFLLVSPLSILPKIEILFLAFYD